jgi:hypothetical protein
MSGKFCADAEGGALSIAVAISPHRAAPFGHFIFATNGIDIGNETLFFDKGLQRLSWTLVRGLNGVNASLDGARLPAYKPVLTG